jgi:hypothetical protein
LVAAALAAPPLTTFIFFLVGALEWAGSGILVLALPLSILFGFSGALLFLAPALFAADHLSPRRSTYVIAGAAAGAAHSAVAGLSALAAAGSQFSALEWLGGFMLAYFAMSETTGILPLFPSAIIGGAGAGWVYGRIVGDALND